MAFVMRGRFDPWLLRELLDPMLLDLRGAYTNQNLIERGSGHHVT
jgi:hypothetical protein